MLLIKRFTILIIKIFLNLVKFCFQTKEKTLKLFTLKQSEVLKDQIEIGLLINFWSLEDGK